VRKEAMADQFPEKFGKYKIIEEVGRGGFADVYKAIDTTLDRTVALKFLEPRLLRDPAFVERFQREAKLAANLKHPNIVFIHELGWEAGTVYIAMEFLEGRTLKEVILQEGALPSERIVNMVRQIASALDYAHGRGLVHRDIKPANVMVGADDHVTVMDFGIAKAATHTALTTTGKIFGTPEYMSPEQAEGVEEPDARSDVYSLGVVVYEMVTGEVPFSGMTPLSVMRGHTDKPPPRPSQVNPDVSPAVETVLLKALAKKREDRYQSAGEMAWALEEATEARVEVTLPPEPEIPVPPPVVKKPVVEEVVSPPVERAAVAEERGRPPIARPAPKAVPKKTPGVGALLAGGLVSVCVVGIIVVALIRPWPTPVPVPPTEAPIEAPTEAPPPEAPTEAPSPPAMGEVIRIGLQAPITGEYAYEGEGFVKVLELAVEQKNAAGGILGRLVEIVACDDVGKPDESSKCAQQLVSEGVDAVIGSYSSTCTEPASAIYNEANILQVTPSSTATRLTTHGYEQFFRVCFLDDRQGLFAAKFIKEDLGIDQAAFLHDNSTYAQGLAEWAKEYYEYYGGTSVFYDAINPEDTDFTPILTKIMEANAGAVYFTGYHPQGGLLLKQSKDLGAEFQWVLGNANNNPEMIEISGKEAAAGAYVTTEPLPKDIPYPEAQAFVEAYKDKYGEDLTSIWWLMVADCFNVIAAAIEATGGTDTDAMAEYLHIELKDYPGVTGPILGYDEKGDRLGMVHVAYVISEDGEFVPY
jgi:branched-chain amino acid transport system substrate-binding protein